MSKALPPPESSEDKVLFEHTGRVAAAWVNFVEARDKFMAARTKEQIDDTFNAFVAATYRREQALRDARDALR